MAVAKGKISYIVSHATLLLAYLTSQIISRLAMHSVYNSRFYQYLKSGNPLILDGGLSNQLESQGHDLNHKLWSARLLIEDPQAIIDAHLHYLKAGAQCLITASYQASVSGLLDFGYDKEQAISLIKASVQLTQLAITQFIEGNPTSLKPFVAASVGPYGASLADGSEYHGNYGVSDAELQQHHATQLAILADTDADVIAIETIPSFQEAKILRDLIQTLDKPAWLSFSCQNGRCLNDGTPIETCIQLFSAQNNPIAVGVNCTNPKFVSELIGRIKATTSSHFVVVYPNSGEEYDVNNKQWRGTSSPNECGLGAIEWYRAGANIIGGCCRIGPEHITQIRRSIYSSK